MRVPVVIRWPGVIRPGTIKNDIFASLDWLPTLVNIAGGAKGNALKKRIKAGHYPGIDKTKLDGVDQTEYLAGRSEKSARDYLLLLFGRDTLGGSVQELEDIFHDEYCADRYFLPLVPYSSWPRSQNIKRDPFEPAIG